MRMDDYGFDSLQLCTRDFRCEECDFDRVMRNESAGGSGPDCRRPVLDAEREAVELSPADA